MAVRQFQFTTGSASLPDTGELSYNGVRFSSLFHSRLQGQAVEDNANRTVKYVEWRLMAEGIVTLAQGATTIDDAIVTLKEKLDEQGGTLTYKGRGFGELVVNPAGGGGLRDVAWGPIPQTFEFIPLGNGLSASVTWAVTVRLPEKKHVRPFSFVLGSTKDPTGALAAGILAARGDVPLLQFNEEISVGYGRDGYSSFSVKGTMELAQTRKKVDDRSVDTTFLESERQRLMGIIGSRIDLTRYYLPTRHLEFSRDRRTMEWQFQADEQAPMGLPPWATEARGNFSIRPHKPGMSIIKWVCSMRCTYVIRKDFDRNNAWRAFVALARARMDAHQFGQLPDIDITSGENQSQILAGVGVGAVSGGVIGTVFPVVGTTIGAIVGAVVGGVSTAVWEAFFGVPRGNLLVQGIRGKQKAQYWAFHWGADEGLYMDSKTVSFEVSWMLLTTFKTVLEASGFLRTSGLEGGEIWAKSVADIAGGSSWLRNGVGGGDVIVDFGGGEVT
jgi:hypothetical protein